VRLPGSRTTSILAYKAKAFVFDKGNFQSVIDLREKRALEESMGFHGQFDEHRRFQIELLKAQGLRSSHQFLELGCGPLTAAIPVIQYLERGHYTGVDIRSSVLNMGWREIGKAGLSGKNPRLIFSDSFADDVLARDQRFDLIYSFSVLYHLSDEILNLYFSIVAKRLGDGGKCIANVNEHMPSDRWLEFPFLKRTVYDYSAVATKHGLRTENLGDICSLGFKGSGSEGKHPLLIFQRKAL
jgi:SAM-dependent methyltransferase